MKFLLPLFVAAMLFTGCKQCVQCRYSTFKGTETTEFCSSTKEDQEVFIDAQEAAAILEGSTAYCEKGKY